MTDKLRGAAKAALDAMKLARGDHGTVMLAYPAIESWLYHRVDQRLDDAIKAVEDALAEPAIKESLTVAEPVAFYNFQTHQMRWAKPTTYAEIVAVDVPELTLYAAPPRREWVGLTGPEVDEAYGLVSDKEWAIGGLDDARVFFCAIEAKLKEKNT